MTLPTLPEIPEAYLARQRRPYEGPIEVGAVFAWEPDLPHAREFCVVTRIMGDKIFTRSLDGGTSLFNDEVRFREAVAPTIFKPQKV